MTLARAACVSADARQEFAARRRQEDGRAELGGEAATKQIRELSGIKNATSILYNNYYGWFENVKKGTYKITEAGYAAFEEFEDTIRKLLIQNHE